MEEQKSKHEEALYLHDITIRASPGSAKYKN